MTKKHHLSILSLFFLVILFIGSACQEKESPADLYINQLNKGIAIYEEVNIREDIPKANEKFREVEKNSVISKYRDYKLTDEDKKKIKKATTDYITIILDKVMLTDTTLNDTTIMMMKQQIPILIQSSDMLIDRAITLGQIAMPM